MGYSTDFAAATNVTGAQLAADLNEAGLLGTIPCTVSGTNDLVMAPAVASPPFVLQTQLRASGIAVASNTGAMTASVANGPALPIYKDSPSGPAALSGNEIIAGNYFVLSYDLALAGGTGGWHLETPTVNAAGTVTSVLAGSGLAGGTITTTGTISVAPLAGLRLLANTGTVSAVGTGHSLTEVLDALLSSTQGAILARGASVWAAVTETSWTPALTFGGSGTGITYGTQVGQYYAIGYLIVAMFNIVLTSKGAQSGAAAISLPVTGGGTSRIGSSVVTNYNNLGSVATQPFGAIAASGTTSALYKAGSGTNTALADTDFLNNTTLQGYHIYLSG